MRILFHALLKGTIPDEATRAEVVEEAVRTAHGDDELPPELEPDRAAAAFADEVVGWQRRCAAAITEVRDSEVRGRIANVIGGLTELEQDLRQAREDRRPRPRRFL
jgi:hypothetical protein